MLRRRLRWLTRLLPALDLDIRGLPDIGIPPVGAGPGAPGIGFVRLMSGHGGSRLGIMAGIITVDIGDASLG